MAEAYDIARYLIWRAGQEPEPAFLTNLHVQKLLYYVQGVALASGTRAFCEPIQAWVHGPVVPAVYGELKHYGSNPIPSSWGEQNAVKDTELRALINSVWAAYGRYSAAQLWRFTHSESPWIDARGGIPEDQRCQNVIEPTTLEKHFKTMFDEAELPYGLSDEDLAQAETAFAQGRGVRLRDLEQRWRDAI